jgi:DNA-binding GntR family transcriptional regulator
MALGHHQRILNAVEVRDTATARHEMISHMEQTKRDLEHP